MAREVINYKMLWQKISSFMQLYKFKKANLVFVHASEWLISIDDFPAYEEDVSSGACVKADETLIAEEEERPTKFAVMPIFVLTASAYIFRRKVKK